jgi:hypothetical protein
MLLASGYGLKFRYIISLKLIRKRIIGCTDDLMPQLHFFSLSVCRDHKLSIYLQLREYGDSLKYIWYLVITSDESGLLAYSSDMTNQKGFFLGEKIFFPGCSGLPFEFFSPCSLERIIFFGLSFA